MVDYEIQENFRTDVSNGQMFGANSPNNPFHHVLNLQSSKCATNHNIPRLAEYRYILEKIDCSHGWNLSRGVWTKTKLLKCSVLHKKCVTLIKIDKIYTD